MKKKFYQADGTEIWAEYAPDGCFVRAPVLLMDGRTAVDDDDDLTLKLTTMLDHALGLHRPGTRAGIYDSAGLEAKVSDREQRKRALSDAWRANVNDVGPAALRQHAHQLHGLASSIEGKLDTEAADKVEALQRKTIHETDAVGDLPGKDAARAKMIDQVSNAWRTPPVQYDLDPSMVNLAGRIMAVSPSPAHRYFRPRGFSRLHLFPWHRRPGSHVPYESPNESHASCTPDIAWPISRLSPC
jgi:hypothetical protein